MIQLINWVKKFYRFGMRTIPTRSCQQNDRTFLFWKIWKTVRKLFESLSCGLASIYMFKVNNTNTRTKWICSKLTIKTPERLQALFWCLYCSLWTYFVPFSSVSIVNFEQVNADWDRWCRLSFLIALVFLLLTLNI